MPAASKSSVVMRTSPPMPLPMAMMRALFPPPPLCCSDEEEDVIVHEAGRSESGRQYLLHR